MAYEKTDWNNLREPSIDEDNLNKMETGIDEAHIHLDTTGNPHGTSKSDVGLGNVDNTSDAGKPVSDATQAELDGKAPTIHNHTTSDITDFPATMPPSDHNHLIEDVSGLQSELDSKSDTGHGHTVSDISDFPATMPPSAHNHDDVYFREDEHIDFSAGATDGGKPVKLNEQGELDPSMTPIVAFTYISPFTPTAGAEYPDTTGLDFGSLWDIVGVPNAPTGYEFTTGDLAGRTAQNGDFLIYGSAGFGLIHRDFEPTLYLPRDGSLPMMGVLDMGGYSVRNLGGAINIDEAVNLAQLNNGLNGKANTSHSHTIDDTTGLQAELDAKFEDGDVLTEVLRVGDGTTGEEVIVRGASDVDLRPAYVLERSDGSTIGAVYGSETTGQVVLVRYDTDGVTIESQIVLGSDGVSISGRNGGIPVIENDQDITTMKYVNDGLATKAPTSHSHTISDTTGLQTELDDLQAQLDDLPSSVGDMSKSVYDTDNSGVVDNAENANQADNSLLLGGIASDATLSIKGIVENVTTLDGTGIWVGTNVAGAPTLGLIGLEQISLDNGEGTVIKAQRCYNMDNRKWYDQYFDGTTWTGWLQWANIEDIMTNGGDKSRSSIALDVSVDVNTLVTGNIFNASYTNPNMPSGATGSGTLFNSIAENTDFGSQLFMEFTGKVFYRGKNGGTFSEWIEFGTSAWDDITGKPSTFPPSAHNHTISEVTDLQSQLNAKYEVGETITETLRVGDGTNGEEVIVRGASSTDLRPAYVLERSDGTTIGAVYASEATGQVVLVRYAVDGLTIQSQIILGSDGVSISGANGGVPVIESDQDIVIKKYVDDKNATQDTAIDLNTTKVTGSDRVLKSGDTMTGDLIVPTINGKEDWELTSKVIGDTSTVTDLDTIVAVGWYGSRTAGNLFDNLPPNIDASFTMFVESIQPEGGIWARQTMHESDSTTISTRTLNGAGVWTDWQTLWTSENFDPATKAQLSHTHSIAEVTNLQSELDGKFDEAEHIDSSAGTGDAGKPVKLDANGKLDISFLDFNSWQHMGTFTPATGAEYPDTTGVEYGSFWDVVGVTEPYIFEGGDLIGREIYNGDFMVWGLAGWSIISSSLDPDLYYKIDGSVALTGNLAGGGFKITNIIDGTADTDGSTVGQLNAGLGTKAPTSHSHLVADITDFPSTMQPSAHGHTVSEITDFPSTMPPSAHTHTIADVTDLQTELDGKSDNVHSHLVADITDFPTTMPPSSHTHDYLTDLYNVPSAFPPSVHEHLVADITDFPTSFPPASHGHTVSEITDFPTEMPPSSHTHTRSEISDFAHQHLVADITDFPATMPPSAHTHEIAETNGLQSALDGKSAISHNHSTVYPTGQWSFDGSTLVITGVPAPVSTQGE